MPDDFFRIRLVATILETCGIFFNRGPAGKKLDYFLSFFQVSKRLTAVRIQANPRQYYVYTKDPLPMDIEFIVQDVFALTRPQWVLATNLEAAGRAFQLAMQQDQKTSGLDKVVESVDVESDTSSDDEKDEPDNEADKGLAEDDFESNEDDVRPSTASSSNAGQLTFVKLDGTSSVHGTDSEEEESIVVTREEEEVDPEDEADFEREYAKMMAESLESRKHERKSTFDVPLPMRRKDVAASSESWADETASPTAAPSGTMAFSLLTKRGNRQQVCRSNENYLV